MVDGVAARKDDVDDLRRASARADVSLPTVLARAVDVDNLMASETGGAEVREIGDLAKCGGEK